MRRAKRSSRDLARLGASELASLYDRAAQVPFRSMRKRPGARKVKTLVLSYAAASDPAKAAELAAIRASSIWLTT